MHYYNTYYLLFSIRPFTNYLSISNQMSNNQNQNQGAPPRHDRGDPVPNANLLHASTAPTELIQELKALQSSQTRYAQFDERKVRATIASINDADSELQGFTDNPHVNMKQPYFAAAPDMIRAAALRNRRCLATYLSWRLQSLSGLWWEAQDDKVTSLCTTAEREFLSDYNTVMVDYLNSFEIPVDARAYLSRPPSVPPSNLVEIRGLKNTSFVSTNSGEIVEMYPGKVLSLPFDEAESLLQRGVAELVRNNS